MNRNIELSNEILRLVGPVPSAVVGAADDALLTQLWLAGADARAFDSADALAASGFASQAVIVCGGELVASMARARPILCRWPPENSCG